MSLIITSLPDTRQVCGEWQLGHSFPYFVVGYVCLQSSQQLIPCIVIYLRAHSFIYSVFLINHLNASSKYSFTTPLTSPTSIVSSVTFSTSFSLAICSTCLTTSMTIHNSCLVFYIFHSITCVWSGFLSFFIILIPLFSLLTHFTRFFTTRIE